MTSANDADISEALRVIGEANREYARLHPEYRFRGCEDEREYGDEVASAYRLRVRFHGANTVSRWMYKRCFPLGWLYYRLCRQFLTFYQISHDQGRTWRRVA